MTQISFYILNAQQDALLTACKLCQKALQQTDHSITIVAETEKLNMLDELLWQFEPTSFISHGIEDMAASVCLTPQLGADFDGVVINLTDKPIKLTAVARLLEIVPVDESSKIAGREKYKAYKNAGFNITTFNL